MNKKLSSKDKETLLNLALDLVNDKSPTPLNEQVGDKVIYKKQRGFIIGQAQNGDWLIQVQGNSYFAKPSEVKILGAKVKTLEPPIKFDDKTQKVLFEQFVRCGIFMGNTPVKTRGCYVRYSEWRDAGLNENVNVISDGELNQLPKEQVRVFEDPNEFANPEDYVKGVVIDEASGDVIENVLINAIDYSGTIGEADSVRIIRGPESSDPQIENLPKGVLRTTAV